MLKSAFMTAAAAALIFPAAYAQTGEQTDGHKGHDHSQHTPAPYMGPLSVAPQVEHIFTEAPDDQVIGAEDAPVTIIAYASVTCPHCSKWFIEEWPAFKAEQIDTGKARFILREFPTPPQNLAMTGFIIANCATEESYFDSVVYQLQNQEAIFTEVNKGKTRAAYDAIAARAGMKDVGAIGTCFTNPAHEQKINRSIDRAYAGNIESVPSFLVDGVPFPGEATAASLNAMITSKLAVGVSLPPEMPVEMPVETSE